LLEGADVPELVGPIGGDLGYLKYGIFQGDNRTFSVTLATRTDDDTLRARFLDPSAFDLAASVLTATAAWVEPDRAAAITPVHVMARLLNRQRRFLDGGGQPLVTGFHAVGDAHTCTNPMYGRGCSLAMVHATLVAEAMASHPDDAVARALAFEAATERELAPWYHAAVLQDRQNRGEATEVEDNFAQVIREGLLPAMRSSAAVLRAFLRTFNLLQPPNAIVTDAEVMARVLASFQDRDGRPPEPVLGPPREEMLELLG
jgi:2-polyprenyl-6-methoxyphenol hydroxylase-like FAD-dependent oxidoreductase